jgi:hypothetical protein
MVAVTYGVARGAARTLSASSKADAAADKGKGFFARLYQGMVDARMKQAHRELSLYSQLNFDQPVGKDELPFRGR